MRVPLCREIGEASALFSESIAMSRSSSPPNLPIPTAPQHAGLALSSHRTSGSESDLQLSFERIRLAQISQERLSESAPISDIISLDDVAQWLAERADQRRSDVMQDEVSTRMRRSTSSRGYGRARPTESEKERGIPVDAAHLNRRSRPDSPMGPRPAPGSTRVTVVDEKTPTWSVDIKTMKFSFPPLASVLAGSSSSYQAREPSDIFTPTSQRDKGKRKAVDYSQVSEMEYGETASDDELEAAPDDGFDPEELQLEFALQLSAEAAIPALISLEGEEDKGEGSWSPVQWTCLEVMVSSLVLS